MLTVRDYAGSEMTEQDRDSQNVKEYERFRAKGSLTPSRNECEICGFLPYTKNKYREKQDHLAKSHFKVEGFLVSPREV
jgi:hypothetical protein